MKCGRGWGPGCISFPSTMRTWVQQCFRRTSLRCSLANEPPPVTCWYRSRKRLELCWGDSPSLPLSEASKVGRWRAPLAGLFRRRLPLVLTGCTAAASRRSNPGQSLPRRMGTGRSFITPTSTGQAPGAAEMVTLRAGTCRVADQADRTAGVQ